MDLAAVDGDQLCAVRDVPTLPARKTRHSVPAVHRLPSQLPSKPGGPAKHQDLHCPQSSALGVDRLGVCPAKDRGAPTDFAITGGIGPYRHAQGTITGMILQGVPHSTDAVFTVQLD
jgi:hypothetical protein